MSSLNKLEFNALTLSGSNYLPWAQDAKIFLGSKGLEKAIEKDNKESAQSRYQTLFIRRHHLAEDLKLEYLTVDNPAILWENLTDRFNHQKSIILPKARNDWINLRFQDFPTVAAFNSALFKIVSQLRLCGDTVEDASMIDKTLSTFHANQVTLQQAYREHRRNYQALARALKLMELIAIVRRS